MNLIQTRSVSNQVDEILLERIRDGTYSPGNRIPSESELSDEFGVSRATVRTALAKLAANGMIIRKQGNGTFVNARIKDASAHFGNLWDLVQLIEGNGYKSSIRLLSIEQKPATEKEALVLALEPGDELIHFRRLFYADQRAVILADNAIPAILLREPLEKVDGGLHIRDIFKNYFHQKIAFAITDIRSAMIDADAHTYFEGEAGRTILQLDVTFYGMNNLPLAYGVNDFDDSILRLSLVQAWS
ncbi:MAG: GntR family transcriptional regulator [Chloroflexi bacterium]|nr:GntR family transcriptional regulator [Chloroflexota bacterium]